MKISYNLIFLRYLSNVSLELKGTLLVYVSYSYGYVIQIRSSKH